MANDRIPLVLKRDDWPDQDRQLWVNLLAGGGFMEDCGPGASWSAGTRQIRQQGYGQWLSFLMRYEPTALVELPHQRITEARVRAYLQEMQSRLKPNSQTNLMVSLLVIAKASAPKENWAWLERAVNRLTNALHSVSVPAAKPITARRLFRQSLKRLSDLIATCDGATPTLRQSIQFRQSLMIGFLIARPVRRRALLAMEVNKHLVRRGDGFQLCFDAVDMKDKKQRGFPLPNDLVEPMQAYLDRYRPVLLRGKQSTGLWISQCGEPLTPDGFSRELPKVVQRQFGVIMRPHAFRHVAATSIAETDPEHMNIIKDILGHATLAMAEKHYNRATGISCCNALQSIVEDIRKNVPKIGRVHRGHRDPGTCK